MRTSRRFFNSVSNHPWSGKRIALNLGSVAVAAGAGSLLYDFLSRKNLERISESFDLSWDDEWDRYVRVPKEMHADIQEWFIAPDPEIVSSREKYDLENDIGVREMIMVRHGQYITEDGSKFGELTDIGREQAFLTGKRLSQLLKHKAVRCIYHSDMIRAKQTAEQIGKSFPGIELRESSLLSEGIPADPDPPSPNCPDYVEAEGKRLEKAYRTFFARPIGEGTNGSVDILVGHGNCFRFFVCRAMQIDPRFWLRMAIYNCGISSIDLDPNGGVSVKGVGDIGHLPSEKITYS
jgi:serine/threonine-protein phosphatase PGAM5